MTKWIIMTAKGSVRLRVPDLIRERGWTITELKQRSGLAYNTANALANGFYNRIGLDTIAALCNAFDCEPGDLFEYNREDSETS